MQLSHTHFKKFSHLKCVYFRLLCKKTHSCMIFWNFYWFLKLYSFLRWRMEKLFIVIVNLSLNNQQWRWLRGGTIGTCIKPLNARVSWRSALFILTVTKPVEGGAKFLYTQLFYILVTPYKAKLWGHFGTIFKEKPNNI